MGWWKKTPALLTSTSMPPSASAASSAMRLTWPGSAMSAWTTTWPSPGSSSRSRTARSAEPRWWIATRSPAAAKAVAIARPMPLDAPVTSTARPLTVSFLLARVWPVDGARCRQSRSTVSSSTMRPMMSYFSGFLARR